jgi:ribosomal protein RSM22 (predicted rRNA methylase)
MRLPTLLEDAIQGEVAKTSSQKLSKAAEQLSQIYREKRKNLDSNDLRLSYLSVRLPATYAAVFSVLQEFKRRLQVKVKRILDLGAGPGTASWAAVECFEEVEEIHCFEKDPQWIEIGKRLASHSEQHAIREALWHHKDLSGIESLPPADLAIFSYSLGELSLDLALSFLKKIPSDIHLMIVEPGTPSSFEKLRKVREHLIGMGWHLVAPCPHQNACPMKGMDWCHFSKRLERSAHHQRVKGGTLGYEDEKFSYLIFSPSAAKKSDPRIIRHPLKHPGHQVFTLCTEEGVKNITISKRSKEYYKKVKKLKWGDVIHLNDEM